MSDINYSLDMTIYQVTRLEHEKQKLVLPRLPSPSTMYRLGPSWTVYSYSYCDKPSPCIIINNSSGIVVVLMNKTFILVWTVRFLLIL